LLRVARPLLLRSRLLAFLYLYAYLGFFLFPSLLGSGLLARIFSRLLAAGLASRHSQVCLGRLPYACLVWASVSDLGAGRVEQRSNGGGWAQGASAGLGGQQRRERVYVERRKKEGQKNKKRKLRPNMMPLLGQ
jgi:hypothetical protein